MSIVFTLLCASLCASVAGAQSAPSPFTEGRLSNGLRYLLVHAPLADDQVSSSVLPWGLLSDGGGQAQYALLMEKLLVAAVPKDGDGVQSDPLLFAGETMGLSLRLDSYGPAALWMQGLQQHARWLDPRWLDQQRAAAALQAAQQTLDLQQDDAFARGFTHRAALAAFNQVLRFGHDPVSVVDDLRLASAAELTRAAAGRLGASAGALFLSVGPVPAAELLPALEQLLASLPAVSGAAPAPSVAPAQMVAPGDRVAHWDVKLRHYLEWYAVPDGGPVDRAAADALAMLANGRFDQRGSLRALDVDVFAAADLVTPEGRFLLVSASLPIGLELDHVRRVISDVLAGLSNLPDAPMQLQSLIADLAEWPDFEALRAEAAGTPGVEWVEAMQALFLMYACENTGLSRVQLAAACAGLRRDQLEGLAQQVLQVDRRGSLLLLPPEAPMQR